MRDEEIKFRFWLKKKGEMLEWIWAMQDAFNDPRHGNCVLYQLFNDPEIVKLQFTGIKDMHGKDIYEGDIIQYKESWVELLSIASGGGHHKRSEEEAIEDYTVRREIVRYGGGKFYFNLDIPIGSVSFGERRVHQNNIASKNTLLAWDFEVIGNKYENPELMEQ